MTTRICATCNQEFPLTVDHFHASGKWFYRVCKLCRSATLTHSSGAAKRKLNPDSKFHDDVQRRVHVEANRQRIQKMKIALGCIDCGYNKHPDALHFDHLPGYEKKRSVSAMLAWPWATIETEIAKCEVVCANCHAVRTASRRQTSPNP